MGRTYGVEKTVMYPNEWYGGPYWNGQKESNCFIYYFATREEAEDNVLRLLQLQER